MFPIRILPVGDIRICTLFVAIHFLHSAISLCNLCTISLQQTLQNYLDTPCPRICNFGFLQQRPFNIRAPPSLCLQFLRLLCRLCRLLDSTRNTLSRRICRYAFDEGCEWIHESTRRGSGACVSVEPGERVGERGGVGCGRCSPRLVRGRKDSLSKCREKDTTDDVSSPVLLIGSVHERV